jgi:adenine C2-methylase RlmN of 23S rRNA A2503 and tRNA A37
VSDVSEFKSGKILMIDNDPRTLEAGQAIMASNGCKLIVAKDLETAYLTFARLLDDIALVILDPNVGDQQAQSLAMVKFFRQNAAETAEPFPAFNGKILLTTSNPSLALAREFDDLHIIGCLLKPFKQSDFLQAVRVSLEMDPAELMLETGEKVVYEWGSEGMRRQMVVDKKGNVYKTGYWKRSGVLSICVPVVTGYCSMRCAFCPHAHTAKGSTRKRSVQEIINSVKTALAGTLFSPPLEEGEKFDLAFTGEGEPGLNLDNIIIAINQLSQEYSGQIRRLVVSTVTSKAIRRLLKEDFSLPVQLQISSTFLEDERQVYMPGASALEELLGLGWEYWQKNEHKLPVIVNYILIKDLTDSLIKVRALRKLLIEARQNQADCFVVKLSNFSPIKVGGWQASSGKARQIRALLAEKNIPSFFWHVPPREFEGLSRD